MSWKDRPISVTGGSGFLGSHLVAKLREDGLETAAIDVVSSPGSVHGDVLEYSGISETLKGAGTVFHLAGELPPHGWSQGKKGRMWETMVDGTENVLRASHERGVGKVVYLSSSAVYGVPGPGLVKEDSAKSPLDEYGKAKVAAEGVCKKYSEMGLDVTVIRPMTILGDGFVGILRSLMEFVYRGRNVPFLGRGENRIQMVHVSDVVSACILAAGSPSSRGEAFNIASHDPPTVREEVEALIAHAKSKSKVRPLPGGVVRPLLALSKALGGAAVGKEVYTLGDKTFILSTEKAEGVLGWRPSVGNVEALNLSYDWFSTNHDRVKLRLSLGLRLAMALL